MRNIILIAFVTISNFIFSQQTIELCLGETKTVTYYSITNGVGIISWSVNGVLYNTEELTLTWSQGGLYNIIVRSDNAICYDEQSIQVTVEKCPDISYWIPNSFTPDDNEYNQVFGPVIADGFSVTDFNFSIFNRWGQLIWESKDPLGRWNGFYREQKCEDGVYTWLLVFNSEGVNTLDRGHVIILR